MTTTHVQQNISAEECKKLLDSARSLYARVVADRANSVGPGVPLANVEDRLQASVIRPLAMLLGETEELPISTSDANQVESTDTALWEFTRRVTALCAAPVRPPALIEAAAALQDLVCRSEASEGTERASELRTMLAELSPSIRLAAKGPLLVTDIEDIHDWLGQPLPTRPLTALCRCGVSSMKPYCDGSHSRGFDDAQDPSRVADRRDTYVGQQITIFDNRGTCQHSGFVPIGWLRSSA